MEFRFLPAISGRSCTRWDPLTGYSSSQYRGPIQPRGGSPLETLDLPNWMDARPVPTGAEGLVVYPHYLLSYYSAHRRAFKVPSLGGFIFGDSGGYSVVRYGLEPRRSRVHTQRRLDPEDILRWQSTFTNAGALLDLPPVGVPWTTALDKTMLMAKRALGLYEQLRSLGSPFRWWGVAHGWTDTQTTEWWSRISAVYPFTDEGEGWAVRARPASSDPIAIARVLRWVRLQKITRAHFLAAGTASAFATILALGPEAGLVWATCDSGSATTQATRNQLYLGQLRFSVLDKTVGRRHISETCRCASCVECRHDRLTHTWLDLDGWNEYWMFRFLYHNVIAQVTAALTVAQDMRQDRHGALKAILGRKTYYAVLRAFDGREVHPVVTGSHRSLLEGL